MRLLRNNKAFTLMELMIVVAILAILAALSLVAYNHFVKSGTQVGPVNALLSASSAQEQYYSEHGTYATTIEDLSGFNDGSKDNKFTIFSSGGSEKKYELSVASADSNSYRINAQNSAGDRWHISCTSTSPIGSCRPVHDSGESSVVERALQ